MMAVLVLEVIPVNGAFQSTLSNDIEGRTLGVMASDVISYPERSYFLRIEVHLNSNRYV